MTSLITPPSTPNEIGDAGRLLVIQHSEQDGPGVIADLPHNKLVHRADFDPVMPKLDDIDGLIVLGGPMHVYSEENFSSRDAEISLLQQAVKADVPVLGICLGAQVLAAALGARVYQRSQPEAGYLAVELTDAGREDPLFEGCPEVFYPRHMHYDSFELPEGAERLASSAECVEQGFRFGNHTWGLQFHFEMDPRANLFAAAAPDVAASLLALAPTAQRILSNFCSFVGNHAHGRVRSVS